MEEEQLKELAKQLRRPEGEEGIKTGKWMNEGNARMYQDCLKALAAKAQDVILEIGMGNGFFVKDILAVDSSIKYTGCDFSSVMVEESQKNNETYLANGQARFLVNTADHLPFEDATFNKILTVNTIYFWESVPKTLAELARVLQPGGVLVIGIRPKHRMQQYPMAKYGFNMFSKEDLTVALDQNGFQVIEIHENREPDYELNGKVLQVENLVFVTSKA